MIGQPVTASAPMGTNPWEIQVQAPAMFTNSTKDIEVPNSGSIKVCINELTTCYVSLSKYILQHTFDFRSVDN